MKERPILFNDAMVRAIREGRKTQTRRPFKLPKWAHPDEAEDFVAALNKYGGSCAKRGPCDGFRFYTGPFGGVGDRLWVRECYAWMGNEDGHLVNLDGELCGVEDAVVFYRADTERGPYGSYVLPSGGQFFGPWRSSIHMPRLASRLTLEVESVRIERLHEITEDDAKAEELKPIWSGGHVDCWHDSTHRMAFEATWRSIYGTGTERGDYGWDANPLVWVCTFKVVPQ